MKAGIYGLLDLPLGNSLCRSACGLSFFFVRCLNTAGLKIYAMHPYTSRLETEFLVLLRIALNTNVLVRRRKASFRVMTLNHCTECIFGESLVCIRSTLHHELPLQACLKSFGTAHYISNPLTY